MKQVQVTCAGIAVCDIVARPVVHPPPIDLVQRVDHLGLAEGGCALRTSRALGGMGIQTRLVAAIGEDHLGAFLRQSVASEWVEVDWIVTDASTSASLILVGDDGERTIFHHIGANGLLEVTDIESRLTGEVLHIGGALVMPSLDGQPLAELFAAAKARGMRTSLDTVYDDSGGWSSVEAALPHTDLFCPSRPEAEAITGTSDPESAAALLRQAGVGIVMVTDGNQGCWLDSAETQTHVPAMHVDAIDTTGAGDAFMAGAICGMVLGLPPSESARLATAMGALATTTAETFSGPRDRHEPWKMANLEVPEQ